MRRTCFLTVAVAVALVFVLGADLAQAQRGGRGGGRGGGGRGAAVLDEATILEEFDSIVDLIWTGEEEDTWKDIDKNAVEEKQAFITAFWERRDPTPGTEDNEFREVWMARVTYANGAFRGEGRPGWETDRGKFYLVYGQEALVAQERKEVAGSANRGVSAEQKAGSSTNIIWTLDPSQNPFLSDKQQITFAQISRTYSRISGGFDYSEEAFLAGAAVAAYFEGRRANPSSAGPAAAAGGTAVAGATGAASPTPDMLAMQQLMQQGVTQQDLTLKQGVGFIPAAAGNTFTTFNFELGKSGLTFETDGAPGPASLLAFGVLFKKDPNVPNGEQFLRDVKINFNVDPANGTAEETTTHSFGMTLEPGDYRLAWGVMDNASERIATTSYEFTVPNYAAGELNVPSVIIATRLEETADAIDINTVYDTTRVGNLALATDLDNLFGRDDTLLLLYFIQGLGVDPGTQQPSFDIDHRILLAGTDESIARLPTQALTFGAINQEIPLSLVEQIEVGTDYEIEIHIKDQVNGNEIIQRVPFSVRGG
jgi:GWxTD domain-containing protein